MKETPQTITHTYIYFGLFCLHRKASVIRHIIVMIWIMFCSKFSGRICCKENRGNKICLSVTSISYKKEQIRKTKKQIFVSLYSLFNKFINKAVILKNKDKKKIKKGKIKLQYEGYLFQFDHNFVTLSSYQFV